MIYSWTPTHLVCGSAKINAKAQQQQRCRLHNDRNLKCTLFTEQQAKYGIYNTALQLFVIGLHELSLKMLILSEEERWEVDFGPL